MTNQFDRREFARRAVLTTMAAGASSASAEEMEQEAPPAEPSPSREELLLDVIRQQFPSENLTDDVLQQIRRDISSHLFRSRILKSVPLSNGEAPFVFTAK